MSSQPLEQAAATIPSNRRTVLIVEDDASLADVLSLRLGNQGYETVIADSGERGLELARSENPCVILLDVVLPDMSGFEVCQQLVDDEETNEIPVIIVSGLERSDIVRKARAAGCRYFLHKPYDPNALLTLIEQAIDEARE